MASLGLEDRQPGHAQCLDPAVLAQAEFLGEQIVERLDAVNFALLERRSVASSISSARGIFKPTRLWRILSTREDAEANVMAGLHPIAW